MDDFISIPLVVVAIAATTAAAIDVRRFRIPNHLTFPLLGAGVVYHGIVSRWGGCVFSLLGIVVGFGIVVLLYRLGAMGAGDVKLLAGVGAWLGPGTTCLVFLLAAVANALVSLVVLWGQGGVRRAAAGLAAPLKRWGPEERVEAVVARPGRRAQAVPFAAMVALAVLGLLVRSHWF